MRSLFFIHSYMHINWYSTILENNRKHSNENINTGRNKHMCICEKTNASMLLREDGWGSACLRLCVCCVIFRSCYWGCFVWLAQQRIIGEGMEVTRRQRKRHVAVICCSITMLMDPACNRAARWCCPSQRCEGRALRLRSNYHRLPRHNIHFALRWT